MGCPAASSGERRVLHLACAVTLLVLGGCHWVFSFGTAGSDGLAPSDARLEGATRDGDGGPRRDSGACAEDQGLPGHLASCTATCGGAPTDDCDGLPQPRDPYPTQCNRLLYEETFGRSPAASWTQDPASRPWQWTCGAWGQPKTDFDYSSSRAGNVTLPQLDYLVEAKLTFGALDPQFATNKWWSAGVLGRFSVVGSKPEYLLCEAWVCLDPQVLAGAPLVSNPDLHILVNNSVVNHSRYPYGMGAWPTNNPLTFDTASGKSYVLQLWLTKNLWAFKDQRSLSIAATCGTAPCSAVLCSVCETNGKCLRTAYYVMSGQGPSHSQYLPTAPGSVGFRTLARAARFDYVRVFALTDP